MEFLDIERHKDAILDSYFAATQDAEGSADREFSSALRIQALWRGYRMRSQLAVWNFAATEIQRAFRGHIGRVLYHRVVETKGHQERLDYFNKHATQIQRIFRGYLSRRKILDFGKRNAYLSQLEARNLEMTQALKDYEIEMAEEAEREETERQTQQFTAVASKLHHLLSTKTTPGIYRPPIRDMAPTVGDVPVESFIEELGKLHATQTVQGMLATLR
ncbi:IQ calmodulin-binding motif family protein [Carpediemonas membranifera]|uniref:IQ calmodulin-binding motif family protein n=1 Tax=Carpediemonas membranifera TaxID=201153 RepID=A0A8J6BF12_9EUKA|nr:IQ calmodulin-binding motif family protein [Carpediemonas membranifera]|eukprot:KAG9396102.1 IQ calmodulin-binding motif family protein [Carpediemonas membranifera]